MSRKKILIVEDQSIVALNIEEILEDNGYEPFGPIRAGEEVEEELAKIKPDLVLLDILLEEEMNGIEVGQMINEKYNIPFIFLTASSSKSIYEQAKDVSPYGFINKPFEESDLIKRIDLALQSFETDQNFKKYQIRNEAILTSITEIVITTSRKGVILSSNKNESELFENTNNKSLIDRNISEVFKDEIYKQFKSHFDIVISNSETIEDEFVLDEQKINFKIIPLFEDEVMIVLNK